MTDQTNPRPDRLTRPRDGRMVAGVAAAFAERLSLDVSLVRIAFVVSTFFGGLGIGVYLVSWLLIPGEGEARSQAEEMFGNK